MLRKLLGPFIVLLLQALLVLVGMPGRAAVLPETRIGNFTGEVTQRYSYGDYGVPTILTASGALATSSQNPYLFQGRTYDPIKELYDFRTRQYFPISDRFISEDSIGSWGDDGNLGNAFTFEGNNPGSERDPFGLDASWWNKSVFSVEAALPCGLSPDSGVDLFLNERSQYIAKKQQLYDQAARASWQKAEFTNTASAVMWQSLNNVEEFGEKAEALAPTPLAYLGMGLQAVGVDEAVINSWYLESQATPWVYDDSVAVAMGGIVRGTQLADEFVSQRLGVRMFAPNSAVKPFAMGLTDEGMEGFAQARGATTWKQLPNAENWQQGVLGKLADPNTRVHFNLDGVDVWQGVQRAASGRGGPTVWELLQIKQNPQFWDSMQFWKGGEQVSNPFK